LQNGLVTADALSASLLGTGLVVAAATTQNVVTANYTITPGDISNTVVAGTGSTGFFSITLPPAAGFADIPGGIVIKNGDSTNAKQLIGFPADLVPSDLFPFPMLWPNQTVVVGIVNGEWATLQHPGRWRTTATTYLNVDHTLGKDDGTTDGLSIGAGAFKTIQNAIWAKRSCIDCDGQVIILTEQTGPFTETGVFDSGTDSPGLHPDTFIQGNPASPVEWINNGNNTPTISATDFALVYVNGFKFVGTGTGQTGLQVGNNGIIAFGNCEFGAFPGGNHIRSFKRGLVVFETGTYVVSGNANYHLNLSEGSFWDPEVAPAISLPNALAFTAWLSLDHSYADLTNATFTGPGAGAGSTGSNYTLVDGSALKLAGVTLPGSSAGTAVNSYVDGVFPVFSAVSGAFTGTLSNTLAQNGQTLVVASNTSAAAAAQPGLEIINSSGSASFFTTNAAWAGGALALNRAAINVSAGLNGLVIDTATSTPHIFSRAFTEIGRWSEATPGKLVVGVSGTLAGQLAFTNTTSGVQAIAAQSGVALGTGVATLPGGANYNLVGDSLPQTFTNKTISGASNTITNVPISTGVSGLGAGIATAAALAAGAANGFATLDGGGKLASGQIPASLVGALQYQGTWNATTNTPALVSSIGTKGQYYKVGTAGTTSIDGNAQWNVGDSIVFDGATWDKIDGVANEVVSVAGLFGVITAAGLKAAIATAIADITGWGAGVATALGNALNAAGGLVGFNGNLGTPTAGVATNLTGTAAGLTAGNVTTNANMTGDVISVGNTTTLMNAAAIAKLLTGYASGAGTVAATDSILAAFQKLNGNDALRLLLAGGTMTGNIAFSPTTAGVTGTTTNDSAAAGTVGEFIQSQSRAGAATVTISNASPAVVTHTAHGMTAAINNGSVVNFTNSGGALNTGLAASQAYFITIIDPNTYKVSSSLANFAAGTFVNTSSAGSGTQTANYNSALTTGVVTDIGGIVLTAGDWEVSGNIIYTFAASTVNQAVLAAIGTASATVPAASQLNSFNFGSTGVVPNGGFTMSTPVVRLSLSGTQIAYLEGLCNFTTSTVAAIGNIRARRAR
jgi:hypothetical protein